MGESMENSTNEGRQGAALHRTARAKDRENAESRLIPARKPKARRTDRWPKAQKRATVAWGLEPRNTKKEPKNRLSKRKLLTTGAFINPAKKCPRAPNFS